ncbi:helix-turn-helix transcriptional regulator [Paenibacillus daejeonensis]|uniref:helix-turn-helix transcriptional regulator n=1 Tax=Paenibacillus daejeonensis TaxID=135193 RepID=UPI0003780A34|nr:AraC family transcriptional regulator [Paenibacillus daejeonensis]
MNNIPDYHDALGTANLKKGQLPFYILDVRIHQIIHLHHHDFAELSFVIEGSGVEVINGVTHELRPGTASFLLPHHFHEIRSSSDQPLRMYCCMFDISMLFGSQYDFELMGRLLQTGGDLPSYVNFDEAMTTRLIRMFEDMTAEYQSDDFGKYSFIRSKLLEALLCFARLQTQQRMQQEAYTRVQESDKKFWRIIQYIHLHYTDKLTLDDLSQRFNLSAPYISQSFKRLYGQGFLAYIHVLRINNALSLLASTEMSIADITAQVGFDSYRSFTRVFKKLKGTTPGEYRDSFQTVEPAAASGGQ